MKGLYGLGHILTLVQEIDNDSFSFSEFLSPHCMLDNIHSSGGLGKTQSL